MPAPGEDALGVELHALDGVITMAYAHHRPVVRRRRDDEPSGIDSGASVSE